MEIDIQDGWHDKAKNGCRRAATGRSDYIANHGINGDITTYPNGDIGLGCCVV